MKSIFPVHLAVRALAVLCILLVMSCSGQGPGEQEQLARFRAAIENPDANQGLNELIALDQEYNSPLSKLFLSIIYSSLGQNDRADLYFNAIPNIGSIDAYSKEVRRLFYRQKAVNDLGKGNVQSALASVTKIESDWGTLDNIESILFARIQYANKDPRAAVDKFLAAWESNPFDFTESDVQVFVEVLSATESYVALIRVIDDIERNRGYQAGMGMAESTAYERTGLPVHALLAAFKELEYARFHGGITDAQLSLNLTQVLTDMQPSLSQADLVDFSLLTTGLKQFVAGNFVSAGEAMNGLLARINSPFAEYLEYSIKARRGLSIPIEETAGFVALESRFVSHPGYYLSLWLGMKSGPGDYNFNTIQQVLEKIILLAPGQAAAQRAKAEIISLLGLNTTPAKFHLPEEIYFEIQEAIGNQTSVYVDKLNDMASLEQNFYSDNLMQGLKQFNQNNGGIVTNLLRRDVDKLAVGARTRLIRYGLLPQ